MKSYKNNLRTGVLTCLLLGAALLPAQQTTALEVTQKLSQAEEPVRIVCFGDSITGRYYHSGGRRAWSDMLQVALCRLYSDADIGVINAGVSGNTSAQGLARMQTDVLDHHPHLVVIMFGMNDLAYGKVTPEKDAAKKAAFAANLDQMVSKCRSVEAEVDPVYTESCLS